MLILMMKEGGTGASLLLELLITQGAGRVGILLQNHLCTYRTMSDEQHKEAKEKQGQHAMKKVSLVFHYKSVMFSLLLLP